METEPRDSRETKEPHEPRAVKSQVLWRRVSADIVTDVISRSCAVGEGRGTKGSRVAVFDRQEDYDHHVFAELKQTR